MTAITFENREVWQGLFNEVSKEKPAVGRIVRVFRGKNVGKVGVVKKHFPSRFVNAFRYGNDASRAMTQARGRYGFCILVQVDNDKDFFVDADKVMVCYEEGK